MPLTPVRSTYFFTCAEEGLGIGASAFRPLPSHLYNENKSFYIFLTSRMSSFCSQPEPRPVKGFETFEALPPKPFGRTGVYVNLYQGKHICRCCVMDRYSVCVILITLNDAALSQPFIKHLCVQTSLQTAVSPPALFFWLLQ